MQPTMSLESRCLGRARKPQRLGETAGLVELDVDEPYLPRSDGSDSAV